MDSKYLWWIYLSGVPLSYVLARITTKKIVGDTYNYMDVFFNFFAALTSWCNVIVVAYRWIPKMGFWYKKPPRWL